MVTGSSPAGPRRPPPRLQRVVTHRARELHCLWTLRLRLGRLYAPILGGHAPGRDLLLLGLLPALAVALGVLACRELHGRECRARRMVLRRWVGKSVSVARARRLLKAAASSRSLLTLPMVVDTSSRSVISRPSRPATDAVRLQKAPWPPCDPRTRGSRPATLASTPSARHAWRGHFAHGGPGRAALTPCSSRTCRFLGRTARTRRFPRGRAALARRRPQRG